MLALSSSQFDPTETLGGILRATQRLRGFDLGRLASRRSEQVSSRLAGKSNVVTT
jgi:hypothetical protein